MGLFANRTLGGELTYTCLGVNQYQFTYKFYRNCSDVAAPTDITIDASSACFPSSSYILNPTVWSPLPYTTTCPSAITTCNGGVNEGIELWVYTEIVTLPGACEDWRFSATVCCRSPWITTANLGSSTDLYIYCLLNNQDASCNNSPIFTEDPYPFGCFGQRLCFSNEAYDTDGDSLSYQLIEPMMSSTQNIQFSASYSGTQPVHSFPPAQINSFTGEFCMNPTQIDNSMYAVLVSEYRNGILIGQIERDFQFSVVNCVNTVPSLSGLNGTSSLSATLCAGTSYEFSIYSIDPDTGQITYIQWNWGIANSSFVSFGSARDSAHFNWTPSLSDVSSSPHCFIAKVSDDNCPYFANGSAYYCFTVVDSSSVFCGNVSVNEGPILQPVQVYSIPERGLYRLEWKNALSFSNLRVFDSAGRLVIQESIHTQGFTTINLENLSRGIYHVVLLGNDNWSKSLIR